MRSSLSSTKKWISFTELQGLHNWVLFIMLLGHWWWQPVRFFALSGIISCEICWLIVKLWVTVVTVFYQEIVTWPTAWKVRLWHFCHLSVSFHQLCNSCSWQTKAHGHFFFLAIMCSSEKLSPRNLFLVVTHFNKNENICNRCHTA